MSLQAASNYMKAHDTCVVATVSSDGSPEAATVGFSHDDEFRLLIATNQKTRKAANLRANGRVAVVIGFEGSETVQIQGTAAEKTAQELGARLEEHYAKVPGAKKHAGGEGQLYFLISPIWLRYTNYTATEPIFETKDFS